MSRLVETEAFVNVVLEGSFSAAGQRLNVSSSYVSKLVSRLEDRLGVRLLHRTTRRLSLTEVGQPFFEECALALGMVAEAEAAALDLQTALRGRLRATMPTALGLKCLAHPVAAFAAAHPDLTMDIVYLDRFVDLVAEGFDVAIRAGSRPDSSLISRHLSTATRMVVASPAYAAKHGLPETPAELEAHGCLLHRNRLASPFWTMRRKGEQVKVGVSGRMYSNNGAALVAGAAIGLGLVFLPDFHTSGHLKDGRLVRVLPEWGMPVPIYAAYPTAKHVPVKVVTFVDHIKQHISASDWGM